MRAPAPSATTRRPRGIEASEAELLAGIHMELSRRIVGTRRLGNGRSIRPWEVVDVQQQ